MKATRTWMWAVAATSIMGGLAFALFTPSGARVHGQTPYPSASSTPPAASSTGTAAAAPTATPQGQIDPSALQQQQLDAENRGDVAATMAFYADNATFSGAGICITPCVGKAAIQKFTEAQAADHAVVTRSNIQVSGNTVTGRFEVTSDTIRAAGVQRLVGSFTFVASGGKVTSVALQIDLSDPQTAQFIASLSKRSAALPGTGTGGRADGAFGSSWALGALLMVGIGLLGVAGGVRVIVGKRVR